MIIIYNNKNNGLFYVKNKKLLILKNWSSVSFILIPFCCLGNKITPLRVESQEGGSSASNNNNNDQQQQLSGLSSTATTTTSTTTITTASLLYLTLHQSRHCSLSSSSLFFMFIIVGLSSHLCIFVNVSLMFKW